jgi:catechol 2,3-dioxygenase-like lactoylglutathione lyase family enzyme
MGARMMIVKAHHYGLTVLDLDRSIPFYRDLLGLELVRVSERANLPSYDTILGYPDVKLRIAILQHPVNEFMLELVQYVNPPSEMRKQENRYVGAAHIAFEVEDVDAVYRKLTDAGYRTINPPADVIRDGVCVARAMYALDPDGITVEMFQEYQDVVRS